MGVPFVCVRDSPATPPWPMFPEFVVELPIAPELPEFEVEFWPVWLLEGDEFMLFEELFEAVEFMLPLDELFAADSFA